MLRKKKKTPVKAGTMAKGGDTYQQTCIAGMVITRIFLGLLLLYAAMGKLFPVLPTTPTVTTTATAKPIALDPASVPGAMQQFAERIQAYTHPPDGLFLVAGGTRQNVWPDYAFCLATYISPHAALAAWLLVIAEVLAGVLLLFGLGTRFGAFIALGLAANFLLATMHISPQHLTANAVLFLMAFAVFVAGPGRTFGLDGALKKKKTTTPKSE